MLSSGRSCLRVMYLPKYQTASVNSIVSRLFAPGEISINNNRPENGSRLATCRSYVLIYHCHIHGQFIIAKIQVSHQRQVESKIVWDILFHCIEVTNAFWSPTLPQIRTDMIYFMDLYIEIIDQYMPKASRYKWMSSKWPLNLRRRLSKDHNFFCACGALQNGTFEPLEPCPIRVLFIKSNNIRGPLNLVRRCYSLICRASRGEDASSNSHDFVPSRKPLLDL